MLTGNSLSWTATQKAILEGSYIWGHIILTKTNSRILLWLPNHTWINHFQHPPGPTTLLPCIPTIYTYLHLIYSIDNCFPQRDSKFQEGKVLFCLFTTWIQHPQNASLTAAFQYELLNKKMTKSGNDLKHTCRNFFSWLTITSYYCHLTENCLGNYLKYMFRWRIRKQKLISYKVNCPVFTIHFIIISRNHPY